MLEELSALQTSVETHPAFRNTLSVGSGAGLFVKFSIMILNAWGLTYSSLLIELVGGDEVNGEDNLDALCLCLLDQGGNLLRAGLVEEGVTDLCPNAQR